MNSANAIHALLVLLIETKILVYNERTRISEKRIRYGEKPFPMSARESRLRLAQIELDQTKKAITTLASKLLMLSLANDVALENQRRRNISSYVEIDDEDEYQKD